MEEESEIFRISKSRRSTQGQKIKNKFNKDMKFCLAQGGLCSYDDERKGNFNVPFRYIYL